MTSTDAVTRGACALPGSPLEAARGGLDLCVHCGFCLTACPTYLALDDENDSPRGRLVLMRGLLDGEIAPTDDSVTRHFDRCLGCRGCESACPSGVPYGQLLEATRATLAATRPIPPLARAMLWIFGNRTASRLAMAATRLLRWSRLPALLARLPRRVAFPFAMLESSRSVFPPRHEPVSPAADATVAPLLGCVMEGLFAGTNRATERVLRMNGYATVDAAGQRCCGALHAHAGDLEGARALARHNIDAFEKSGAQFIAVNAAGCGAMMKDYGHLLADDPAWAARADAIAARARDVSELLAARGPRAGGRLELTVTYDAPCHLHHAQRVGDAPLSILRAIPGLAFVPLQDADQCCGGAGIYNLVEPETSTTILDAKLARIRATGATLVATGNPGCLMQIGAGLQTADARPGEKIPRAVHPVDLLDASYAALQDGTA